MTRWSAEIHVMLKPSVNDPQGQSIRLGLQSLGFVSVEAVRAGKLFSVRLDAPDETAASQQVEEMCARLLANPVIEQYAFSLTADPTTNDTEPPAL